VLSAVPTPRYWPTAGRTIHPTESSSLVTNTPGTVAALGLGVTEMAVGDPVAVEPHKGCGVCANCRDGLYTTCLNYGRDDKGIATMGFRRTAVMQSTPATMSTRSTGCRPACRSTRQR